MSPKPPDEGRGDGMEPPDSPSHKSESHGHLAQVPRIRDITGIRIHQLTLPDALFYAAKLVPSPSLPTSNTDTSLAGPSSPRLQRAISHTEPSRRQRRISTSTLPDESTNSLARSVSASLAPASPIHRAPRTARPRAPTLAGEAIELALDSSSALERHDEEIAPPPPRRLVRCFVTLKLPPQPPPRANGTREYTPDKGYSRQRNSSTASSPATSPPQTPRTSASKSGLKAPSANSRQRTTSLPSAPALPRDLTRRQGNSSTAEVPLSRTISDKARSRTQVASQLNSKRPALTLRRSGSSSHSIPRSPLSPTLHEELPVVPFYISPIHKPSTYPQFLNLSPDDLAPWMTVEEAASTRIVLEVWYDDPEEGGWRALSGVGGEVDMALLRRVEGAEGRQPNGVQLMFAWDTKGVYYLPTSTPGEDVPLSNGDANPTTFGKKQKETVMGVVERSMRETRMKKGVGVGALHQLVNMQSVLVDTQRDVAGVQRKIDRLLAEDADHRAIRREIAEREEKCRWIREKIDEVGKTTREVRAHVTLREQALEERTSLLEQARAHAELMHGHASELTSKVNTVDAERSSLINLINHYRMSQVQTLDSVFPIAPLHPPTLLYSILGVPLPIPAGPKDPAPPLSLAPGSTPDGVGKIDEKTTAAALGYVAMVVQILGNLGGAVGGVPYPVTCAGSRSLVKDVVSVMQGPRSFPLYAKGVERYRYEYAVFLLNKNIETLMQEANIRLLDLRHTLPNLKTLLLTLSSPVPSTSLSSLSSFPALSRSSTFVDSRASSRQTSAAYPRPWASPRSVGSSNGEPSPGKPIGGVGGLGLGSPSPVKRSGLRRSLLSGDAGRADDEKSVASMDELESVSAA